MRAMRIALFALPLILAIGLVGCATKDSPADDGDGGKMPVSVSLSVFGAGNLAIPDSGNSCHGVGDFADIGPETSVLIEDGSGTVLTTGQLGEGTPSSDLNSCSFASFNSVKPTGDQFYQIEIAGHGSVRFTAVEMWLSPSLTLSSDGDLSSVE